MPQPVSTVLDDVIREFTEGTTLAQIEDSARDAARRSMEYLNDSPELRMTINGLLNAPGFSEERRVQAALTFGIQIGRELERRLRKEVV